MEEKPEKEKKPNRSNKFFAFGTIALIVIMLIISVAEIISLNSLSRRLKSQEKEMDRLANELNYYKDKSQNDYFEGTEGQQ